MNHRIEHLRHAIVSTDLVLFSFINEELFVILVEVKNKEYSGKKAFPGSLIFPGETADDSVKRIIKEKLGLNKSDIYFEELGAYSEIDRDIRGRVVSIAYIGLINSMSLEKKLDCGFEVVEIKKAKNLGYDHDKVFSDSMKRLRDRFSNSTIAQRLLNSEFTMTELFTLYTKVLGKEIDKRNFIKKIKSLNIIKPSGGVIKGHKHRPAKLMQFKDKEVKQLEIF